MAIPHKGRAAIRTVSTISPTALRYPDLPARPEEMEDWWEQVRTQLARQDDTSGIEAELRGLSETVLDLSQSTASSLAGLRETVEASATANEALARRTTIIETQLQGQGAGAATLAARIARIEQTYTTRDYAEARILQEISAAASGMARNTSALVREERVARTTADSALAQSITDLSASVTDGYNTLSAQITSEHTAWTNADTALAQSITSLSAQVSGMAGISSTVDLLAQAYIVGGQAVATAGFKLDANGKIVALQGIAASGGAQGESGEFVFTGADLRTDNYSYGASGWRLTYGGKAYLADAEIWGSLRAGKVATAAEIFNPSDPAYESSTFPAVTVQSFNQASYVHGGTPQCIVTFYGWRTGSGFARNRYGRSDPVFLVMFNGVVDHYVSLYWRHQFSGGGFGGWNYINGSEATEPVGGYGQVSSVATLTLSGQNGQDNIQFGVKATNSAGSFFGSDKNLRGVLTVLCFNF